MDMEAESRGSARVKVTWSARIERGQQGAHGTVRNISVNGAYVETEMEIKTGDTVKLTIRAMHNGLVHPLQCEATVTRHIFLSEMRGHGYGVVLGKLPAAQQAFLEETITAKMGAA